MALYTLPFTPDRYPPMRTVLKALREADISEDVINSVYPHVKAALRSELDKAVKRERSRRTPSQTS